MRTIQKTEFSGMSSGAMVAVSEVLEIRSVKTTLGYFVPAGVWELLRLVIVGIEWDDTDELGHEALAIVQGDQEEG